MAIEEQMVEYYARRSTELERVYEKPERQPNLALLKQRIEDYFKNTDAIEVACGTGYWTQFAARLARSWIATDINEESLGIARAKPLDPRRVRFMTSDAYAMPLFEQRFTAGLAAFWWSHVPRPRLPEFLRTFHRLLAPGARVWIMDNRFVDGSSTAVSRIDADGNSYQRRVLEDGTRFEVLKNFPDGDELRTQISGLGEEIRVQWLDYYWVLTYRLPSAVE